MRSLALLETAHSAKCELAAQVLCSFRKLRLQVTGGSMLPSIWPGDTLLIESVNYDEVGCGEVVLFLREQRPFAYRALGRNPADWWILTRGHAMCKEDPLRTRRNFWAKSHSSGEAGKPSGLRKSWKHANGPLLPRFVVSNSRPDSLSVSTG
jgi:hypothetical protein